MKYLFAPVTTGLFYLITYWSFFGLVLLTGLLFSLSWLLLIVLYLFIAGAFYATIRQWLLIALRSVMEFYNFNIYLRILHAFGAFAGIVSVGYFFYQRPPLIVGKSGEQFLLYGMWDVAWFKTILVVSPVAFTIIFIIAASIVEVLRAKPLPNES